MRKFLILILFIFFFGCVPIFTKMVPITQNDNPIISKGVSFHAPPNGSWKMLRKGYSLLLVMTTSRTNSHLVILSSFKLHKKYDSRDEFLNSIKRSWEYNIKNPRFIVDLNEIVLKPYLSDYCIFVHRIYRDIGAVNKGRNPYLLTEEYGYFFIHPDYPNEVIKAMYSERFKEGEQTNTGIENRINFMKSLKLKKN